MRRFFAAGWLTLSFLFFGCPARSLNPLFTEEESVYNPALTGQWRGDGTTLTFIRNGAKEYRAVYRDAQSGDSLVYAVRLGTVGERWFLDSAPMENPKDDHLVTAHMVSKVWFEKDRLHIAMLEADWLAKMIDAGKMKVSHVRRGKEVILTAPTATLKQLAETFGGNKEAFPESGAPFVRVK